MTSPRGSPKKGCWMNSPLTSELKQTNMKKTQSVRNMNNTSIMIHLIEQERTTNHHCEDTVAPATLLLRSRCKEMNQIWFGHAALRQKALWRNTFGWETSSTTIWNLIGWTLTLWTNKKTSQRHDTSCNRRPQSLSINARPGAANLSSCRGRLKNQCSASKTWTKHQSWYTWVNKNEQQNPLLRHCCACHALTQITLQRDEPHMIWSLCSPTKGVGWTHHGRLHHLKTNLQANEETDKNMTQKAI